MQMPLFLLICWEHVFPSLCTWHSTKLRWEMEGENAFKELRTIKGKLWQEIKDFNLRMESQKSG